MSSLLTLLTNTGSPLSYGNGSTPEINPGATNQSKLHTNGDEPGYSLDGSNFTEVNTAAQLYNDGVGNALPQPSQLDMNGQTPSRYLDNLPG